MWTGISALLARAMQMDARKLYTHLFRLGFVGFIYFSLLGAQIQAMSRGAPGLNFLWGIVMINAVFITLAGVSFFSSAITEEKEENTLGLLQMANIGPMSVLLGKSTSRLIQAFMLLLVQFPFTLLSITLGGVTMLQVLAAYAALFAFLIGLANLALFWSVICRRTGTAAGMTFLMVVLYFIAPSLAMELHSAATSYGWSGAKWYQGWSLFALQVIGDSEVFRRLGTIMTTGFGNSPATGQVATTAWAQFQQSLTAVVSTQVVSNIVFGMLCFLVARLLYGPFTRDVDQQTDTRGLVLRSTSPMKLFSAGRCWHNPLVWKDFHFLTGGYSMAIVKWFAYAGLLGLIIATQYFSSYPYYPSYIDWPGVFGIFAICLVGFLVLEASLYASRIFHDEIRLQTMSALLMLPRSIPYIGYSKAAGCLLGLLPGLFWLMFCGVVAVLSGWDRDLFRGRYYDSNGFLLTVVFNPVIWTTLLVVSLFLHLTALLSLFVKWGALPLAFLIMIVMSYCCPIFGFLIFFLFSAMADEIGMLVGSLMAIIVNVVASFVMQMMIGARLQEIGST